MASSLCIWRGAEAVCYMERPRVTELFAWPSGYPIKNGKRGVRGRK
jgi:hypothetical protein